MQHCIFCKKLVRFPCGSKGYWLLCVNGGSPPRTFGGQKDPAQEQDLEKKPEDGESSGFKSLDEIGGETLPI